MYNQNYQNNKQTVRNRKQFFICVCSGKLGMFIWKMSIPNMFYKMHSKHALYYFFLVTMKDYESCAKK